MVAEDYEIAIVVWNIVGYFSTDRTKVNNIGWTVTSALTLDSIAVPWVTGGTTLHELLGLKFEPTIDSYISLYEKAAAAVLNFTMAGKIAFDYFMRRYYRKKP